MAATPGTYDLTGTTPTVNAATGVSVVELVLKNVSAEDAKDLNDRIDGALLGAPLGGTDVKGRVKFDIGLGATGDVRLYIAHK